MTSASSSGSALRIVVLGLIVRFPVGGIAWHYLQYVMGLRRLGHDVIYIEDSGDSPSCCYDPSRGVNDTDPTYGLSFATAMFDRVELGDRWAYYDEHRKRWHGPLASEAVQRCSSADLMINVSGANVLQPWLKIVPLRMYVDTDPVFTQVRNLNDIERREHVAGHNAYLTFGENFGAEVGGIPDDGFRWSPTRQPVVLDAWPVRPTRPQSHYTTVMQWDSYRPVEFGARSYGMKSDSFGPYVDLPRRTPYPLEIALGSANAPHDLLREQGWVIVDPLSVTRDPWAYQEYIADSRGEFAVAKHGYVSARSGWFSERSAAYLATGRPVVVQDTSFGTHLPTGEGLLVFSTPDEALAALSAVESRYKHHARAARAIAEEHFDSDAVLQRMLDALP